MRVFQKSDLYLSLYPNFLVLKKSVLHGLFKCDFSQILFNSPKITVFSFLFL